MPGAAFLSQVVTTKSVSRYCQIPFGRPNHTYLRITVWKAVL